MSSIQAAADAINGVYLGGPPINPLREQFDAPDIDTAYAIQEINTGRWLGDGQKITGRKIGLTSAAVQAQLGVDQPDYGMLFDTMYVPSGEVISLADVCQPRIEGEIAFVLDRDLDPAFLSMQELIASISYAVAAFEVVGSRIRDWNISLFDTIADNASSGKYVLGHRRVALADFDPVGCEMTLEHQGEVVSRGSGAACLGNPLNAALWLVRKMDEAGRPLRAGDIIMSGALGPVVPVVPGGVYDLRISGLGSARAVFSHA